MSSYSSLANLGWQPFFQHQLSLDEWTNLMPARVLEQHRSAITVATDQGEFSHPILSAMPSLVVGDWMLLNREGRFERLLERKTCFSRKAAGTKLQTQLLSANVDTAFILSSMNEDFNLNRIERFLAMVNASGADPVIVLSKSDLIECPEDFVAKIHGVDRSLPVEYLNCLDSNDMTKLRPWTTVGKTVAVLGSSGVGKSTLINTLVGEAKQSTAPIRESDEKGRHTTTSRSLILMENGGLLLDTPGMRELQLTDCNEGISSTFSDIQELSRSCRYRDCFHQEEPGCSVQEAIKAGKLEQRRLDNYHKLVREDAFNSSTMAEKRAKEKALGKFYKRTMEDTRKLRGRE